ncbi:hypothetical protein SSX86_006618 [Deinandra increscens subsp. villosa]|uniref:Uncharacterized protein n=1 Tax=Deinandra increscens subsp. villosa TaxID=3103831 RepID=A0AAP0H3X9_9ASTR
MSTPPFDQIQQQPPPLLPAIERQDYTYHHRHGSVGPAIGALAVIMVLGAIAVMIGRICSGRRILNQRQYDFDGWVETKCSSCVDGRLSPPPPPCAAALARVESGGEADAAGENGERRQDGEMGGREN